MMSVLCLILLIRAFEASAPLKVFRNGRELLRTIPLVTYLDSLEAFQEDSMRFQHFSIAIIPKSHGFCDDAESNLSAILATRASLFDNSLIIDPVQIDNSTVLETRLFTHLFPLDVIDAASNVIDDMKQLAQIMLSFNLPITCRLALMQGVRCPQWHEDYVRLRLIKSYLGFGTDWVDPGDKIVRLTNWINAQLDRPLTVPPEKLRHAKEGDILVLAGRRHENGVPVLHRSPISSTLERRLLYTVTIA